MLKTLRNKVGNALRASGFLPARVEHCTVYPMPTPLRVFVLMSRDYGTGDVAIVSITQSMVAHLLHFLLLVLLPFLKGSRTRRRTSH